MPPPLDAKDKPELIARRYRVHRRIGRGGMGEVFEATDEVEGHKVALKRLVFDLDDEPASARLRFRKEFHTLASLVHPRIVSVYDFGTDSDLPMPAPFYTMELLDGKDLKEVGILAHREACALLRDVAGALAMLHARGLVHRDVAAKNVRRLSNGRAKVMDFGILANFGIADEVAGTAQYVAPESMRELPLDGRSDLYALGVLAYVLLTGKTPYAARSFAAALVAWDRGPPQPPSHHTPGIPGALDQLVLSLLAFEPAGRPASAAEVMARLSGIAGLAEDAELEVRQGYLNSAALVGRDEELALARKAVSRAVRSKGGALFIRAASGAGKSRFLTELVLEAKLSGARVASASCETAAPSPFGTIDDLAAALLRSSEAEVLETARPHASLLSRVVPALRAHLGEPAEAEGADDPAEQRLQVQRAVADWLIALSARAPLCLFVDDIQRCDEASAAALAALAREAARTPLLVVATQRTGEDVRAHAAVTALAKEARAIELSGLSEAAMTALVQALFGDVPNASRLSTQLFAATQGSPAYAMEIARQLVHDQTVRHTQGIWVLPSDLRTDTVAPNLAGAMDRKVASLSPEARRLGEVLALVGGALSLELIADLHDDPHTFVALDELTARGFLRGDGRRYFFQHDSGREALIRAIAPERRVALHKAVGERLAKEPDAEARAAEIGFHLLQGGAQRQGAELLERAGRTLYDAQALLDCLAPLEASVKALEALGEAPWRTLPLRRMLLAAGFVSDRAVGSRYALSVVREYRKRAGIELAERLRFLGRPLALVVGLALVSLKWSVAPRSSRGASPLRSITLFAVSLGYALALANAENRADGLAELVSLVDPFDALRGRIPYAIYLASRAFPDISSGRFDLAGRRLTEALPIFQNDRLAITTEKERTYSEAGLRGLRVIVDVNQLDPRLHEDCDRIDALGFRYYRLVAQATKVVHHRYRGEEGKALALERALEIPSIQLGSWSTDLQVLVFSHPGYVLCRDVLGLERCVAAFERLISQGFHFEVRLAILRTEWLRERGDAKGAVAQIEPTVRALSRDDAAMHQWGHSAYAEALLADERWADAKAAAEEVLVMAHDPDCCVRLPQLRSRRILALAEAALGHGDVAKALLREGIEECERLDVAPLAGAMHEARARIALAEGDRETYRAHATEVLRWLRPTENPALIGFAERLLDAGKAFDATQGGGDDGGPTQIATAVDGPSTSTDEPSTD